MKKKLNNNISPKLYLNTLYWCRQRNAVLRHFHKHFGQWDRLAVVYTTIVFTTMGERFWLRWRRNPHPGATPIVLMLHTQVHCVGGKIMHHVSSKKRLGFRLGIFHAEEEQTAGFPPTAHLRHDVTWLVRRRLICPWLIRWAFQPRRGNKISRSSLRFKTGLLSRRVN